MLTDDVEVFEIADVGVENSGFETRAAVETPLGVAEELDELFFGFGVGAEGLEHALAHGAIGGFVLSREQNGLRGESVFQGVLRGGCFAFVGARTGGVLRVGDVSGDLCGCSHKIHFLI